ncbi:MAG: sugar ABC transporter substrate-binding protein, partial [Lachnospiraceae bacterium]|nr:sugar ABC transporter substrate-binding protein [Lachnospiraceae bacterium]
ELTNKSLAHTYAGIDPEDVLNANKIAKTDTRIGINVQVGDIEAEGGAGDTLTAKRDTCYDNAVKASTADFDSIWEEGLADYLASGGQDIMDERAEKWDAVYSSENIR